MIKLTIEIEETKEPGITSMSMESDRQDATVPETMTWLALKAMLLNSPALIGQGVGTTKEESQNQAQQDAEITRAIIKAGRPKGDV
jgi:hypothetical protein